jgi:DNA-binding HxlR family transcriptional regulator
MKRANGKSQCPINFTSETLGDPWSVLIIRDMVSEGKRTFSEFLDSKERIGRSVLAERLERLEIVGVITKSQSGKDKRSVEYQLTDAGMQAIPIIYEYAVWGSQISNDPQASPEWFAAMKLDRAVVLEAWQKAIEAGSSFAYGPHSVTKQLHL